MLQYSLLTREQIVTEYSGWLKYLQQLPGKRDELHVDLTADLYGEGHGGSQADGYCGEQGRVNE